MNYQSFQPNPPGSQPSEQLPVPERKHFLNKKFIVIFVVLVLLGAGSYTGIWWWENRQLCPPGSPCWVMPDDTVYNMDPTANWKTYTNTQYGIEIKYPSVNNDFNPASNIGVSLLDNTQPEPGPGAFWFGLSQKIWHDRLTNKSKYKVGDACSPLGEQETQCTVLSLNPYAILTKVNWAAPVNFQYSLLILTDKFEITIGPLSRDVQNETLNQILSTFKFTNLIAH